MENKKMVITPKGDVYPCVAMKSLNFPCKFNNIKIHKLDDIMNVFKKLLEPLKGIECYECPAQLLVKLKYSGCLAKILMNIELKKKDIPN